MINISDNLNNYITDTVRVDGQFVRAKIVTKTGVVYNISDSDLISGSVKINKKSVSGSTFDIGECYINEASLSLINKSNRFSDSFDNAKMDLFYGVNNDILGLNEEVQIGSFIIPPDTTIRKIASIQISGDSVLSKLDKKTGGVETQGTPYDLVMWCCESCDIDFAMSKAEFELLSENTSYTLYITDTSSISTYRDVVMYVSQLIGGFATDTNDGKLTFKVYNTNNSVFDINNDTVASSKLGDSSYKLDGVSIPFGDTDISVLRGSNSDYLLELDSNPLFDKLTEDLVRLILTNIWNQLKDLDFRSFNFSYNGNPALECGDILNNDIRGIRSFITSLSWTYHGKSSVEGATLDKRVKTGSQGVKKASTSGGSSESKNELNIIKYISTSEYKLSIMEEKIVQMFFTLPAGVSPFFTLSMYTKNELAGLLSTRINYDNVDMIFKPKQHLGIGYNTFSISKSFDAVDSSMEHLVSVYASFIQDENQEISSTNPIIIEPYAIEANIMGYKAQGSGKAWSGRYELSDTINLIKIGSTSLTVLCFINCYLRNKS